jgi:short-subunit dehydrogenase
MSSTWIIAGATSAIALQFSQITAHRGDQIILLARDKNKLTEIQNDLRVRYQCDVDYFLFDAEQFSDHVEIAKKCMNSAKHPISLLLAFGVMLDAPAGNHTAAEALRITNANYTGVVSVCFAFLPYFKQQKQGHILVLGSVAGDRGRASNFDYGAAKAALIPFCEGLRASLYADNVSVTVMKLGFIDTQMSYGKPGIFLAASPQACAAACLKAAEKKVAEKYFPWFWRWIMLIFKSLPRNIMYRLKV